MEKYIRVHLANGSQVLSNEMDELTDVEIQQFKVWLIQSMADFTTAEGGWACIPSSSILYIETVGFGANRDVL